MDVDRAEAQLKLQEAGRESAQVSAVTTQFDAKEIVKGMYVKGCGQNSDAEAAFIPLTLTILTLLPRE